jgi:serine/threonine-protein kinase
MASTDRSRASEDVPRDLLPVIQASGLLPDRQYRDLRARVLDGTLPNDSRALAQRLVRDRVLTEYQARRLLSNKPQGMVVGRYVIMERIGSGSMGRVYKAHHQLMDRLVALKIIAPEIVTNTRVVSRFQREMRLVGRLDHPNVVRAFDADQQGDTLYIVMEYVSGQSLGQMFKAGGPLPAIDVLKYAGQAAEGLAHAHAQGIVHRDVKPSNLLLSDTGQLKVLDLGLGVLMEADEDANFATADGIAVGTIDYMSPEQACGKEVDGRSDLFSLGCTMYHLITGRLPFPGESPIDRLGRRLSGSAVPMLEVRANVPPAVVRVVDKLLASKPTERFQSADELARVIQAMLRPKSAPKRPEPPAPEASGAAAAAAVQAAATSAPPGQAVWLVGGAQESGTSTNAPEAPAPLVATRPLPAWLRPLVSLAERSPTSALLAVIATLATAFGAGFAASRILGW